MEKKLNLKLTVFILFMSMFMIGADTFIISPLIPEIGESFSVEAANVGVLIIAYSLCYGVFGFLFGPISDGIGRKVMLACGLFSFAVCILLCGVVQNFAVLILLRALSGVAAAAIAPQVWASIGDIVPYENRGRVMGVVSAALATSQILGIPIGAFIASIGGWRSTFYALSLITAIVFLLVCFKFPNIERNQGASSASLGQVAKALKLVLTNKKAVCGLLVTLFAMFGQFGVYSYLGVWLNDTFDMSVRSVGFVVCLVGIGNFMGNVGGGYLSDIFGKKKIGLIGTIITGVTLFLLPFTSGSIVLAIICVFVWFLGGGGALSSVNSLVSELVPSLRGTIMAMNSSCIYLGTTLGVAVNGVLLGQFGYISMGVSGGIALLLSTLILYKYVNVQKESVETISNAS